MAGKFKRHILAFLFQLAGEKRNEGGGKSAFRNKPAEHVRDAEGNKKSIGHRPGAKNGRHQNIAQETKYAADHGIAANSGDGFKQTHLDPISPPDLTCSSASDVGGLFGRRRLFLPFLLIRQGGEEFLFDICEFYLVGDFETEAVFDIKNVNRPFAICGDMR